ncbi:DUF72 domain-containing protein [uncultured Ferrovibrio sp.]|jgi:uncharacterized protein YecE (DUF72 family)|uniref:DUF72 domain-containing protein n=1 Tax=uncultured Ferrovibrio sp. TaxID=1576913 RepID=UPI0026120C78|nr:DUF72 domain-containing protein [uncultured Ferrovibrio sp.]
MTIRIGISGWTYTPWRGVFYPEGLRQKDEMAYAAATFPSIEVNGTFYGSQWPASFKRWAAVAPEDFVFSIKAPRYITHILRLRDARSALANFLASGLLALGPKLGPILWQMPPSYRFDEKSLAAFLRLLPHDTEEASKLAARHDRPIKGGAFLTPDAKRPMRHALEIRHDSFRDSRFIDLLREHDVALVVADAVEWPCLEDVTSDFIYARLHGSEQLYVNRYTTSALDRWARKFRTWAEGGEPRGANRIGRKAPRRKRDIFVYFDNDAKVHAPFDAMRLARRLGVSAKPPPFNPPKKKAAAKSEAKLRPRRKPQRRTSTSRAPASLA